MRIIATLALLIFIAANSAFAAESAAPTDFAGVPLGSPLKELKSRYPDVSRNPDSDKQFQVYQVATIHGAGVASPGAFQIYKGRVVGGQLLLDSKNARYWFDTMVARYGQPDGCTYCNDPELATAKWNWPNGTTLKIEGEMLTELTSEGASQRSAWLSRGDSQVADNGDEESDEGAAAKPPKPRKAHHHAATQKAASQAGPSVPKASGWRGTYDDYNARLERLFGIRK